MSGDYWNHVKEAYEEVSIYNGAEVFLRAFRKLPEYIGDLLAAHWILSEVANGGFLQFFLNSTGVLAPEAARAFERMGVPDVAQLVRQAMAYFGQAYPREMKERGRFLAQQSGHAPDDRDWEPFDHQPFEDIERRLYELCDSNLNKIYDVMDSYARQSAG
jgi:hypothetical protein